MDIYSREFIITDNDELATSEGDPPLPTGKEDTFLPSESMTIAEPHNATHRAPPYDTIASREYAMRRIRRVSKGEMIIATQIGKFGIFLHLIT